MKLGKELSLKEVEALEAMGCEWGKHMVWSWTDIPSHTFWRKPAETEKNFSVPLRYYLVDRPESSS